MLQSAGTHRDQKVPFAHLLPLPTSPRLQPGEWSPAGSAACASCQPGSYSSTAAAAECVPCPAGTAQSLDGQTTCDPCMPGTLAAREGMAHCQECPQGTYGDEPRAWACTECPLGHYQNTTGQTMCKACAAGSFAASKGTIECTLCPPGTYGTYTGSAALGCSFHVNCVAGDRAKTDVRPSEGIRNVLISRTQEPNRYLSGGTGGSERLSDRTFLSSDWPMCLLLLAQRGVCLGLHRVARRNVHSNLGNDRAPRVHEQ